MANIMTMIEDYEDGILNAIGAFIKKVLGLPVYLKDKPFIAPESPYVTLRVITSTDSGGWGQKYMYTGDKLSYEMDNTYQIEVMIYRGRPMPAMTYLLSAFRGFEELKYRFLQLKGVAFLSASNVTEANTILDADKTQLRSRAIFTFNTCLISEDAETKVIDQISYTTNSFRSNYEDTKPVSSEGITTSPNPHG